MIFATRFFPFPQLETAKRHHNLAAWFLLLVFTLLAVWNLVSGGIVVGKDPITQYYPWYSFLGERLRAGDIPAWNPYQFSGAPFAADPLSGWTYLPAVAQAEQSVLRELKNTTPTVYSDDQVDVLENRDALPRAWIVHSAKQATRTETLRQVVSGVQAEADPQRQLALGARFSGIERIPRGAWFASKGFRRHS